MKNMELKDPIKYDTGNPSLNASLEARKKAIELRQLACEFDSFKGKHLYDCQDDIKACVDKLNGILAMIGNPWSPYTWNMVEQARIFRANPPRAERLAAVWGKEVA